MATDKGHFYSMIWTLKCSIYSNTNYTGWCMSWIGVLQGWLKGYELACYEEVES